MSDEEIVTALAKAIPHEDWCHEIDRSPHFPCACAHAREYIAAALLPVVRQVVAEELRAAAEVVARTAGIKHQATAVTAIRNRADALDPS